MLERFAIFAPALGVRQDFPAILLSAAMLPDAENVRLEDGEIHRVLARAEMLADAPDSILHYHWFDLSTGVGHLLGFTDDAIYIWDEATDAWVDHLTPALSATAEWSSATFADQVIATNGINKVLVGDDATPFAVMGAAGGIAIAGGLFLTAARFVVVFENYVLFGHTTENGTLYPKRIRWCAIGDMTDFATAAAGYNDIGGGDGLTGAVRWGSHLILLKERSIHRMYLTAGDTVFQTEEITSAYGCKAPLSAVVGKDGLPIFFATDKTFRTVDGQDVSGQIDDTLRQIPDAYISLIRGWRVDELGEIWWAVPVGVGQTTNNKVLVLAEGGVWTVRDMPVVCFGQYRQESTVTIAGLDLLFGTVAGWAAAWPSIGWMGGSAGFMTDLVAAGAVTYDAHSGATDAGSAFTGRFDLMTDLGPQGRAEQYKRLLNVRVYAMNEETGTLTVEAQADEDGWETVGAASLDAGATADLSIVDLPCDVRARHFRIRVSSTNHFRFLGALFEFTKDGYL